MKTAMPTLIFDLDGTLIDSRKDLALAVNQTRKASHLSPLSLDEIVSYVGDGALQLLERSMKDVSEQNTEQLLPFFKKNYESNLFTYTTLYDGVFEGLTKLYHAGYQLALFSNKPHHACLLLMDYFKLSPLLSVVVGAGDQFPLKPSGEAIRHILSITKSNSLDAMMIGDHHTDMNAAKDAGVKSAFCKWGFGELSDTRPDIMLNTFDDLLSYLNVAEHPINSLK